MDREGILVVISGFSGAGKGTVLKELLKKHDQYSLSVSATTRKPREGEEHGREYFFLTREEFEKKIEQDELIEYACYVDHYYGTPREYVLEKMAKGKDVILEIELQGALKIREKFPQAMLLFIMPPSAEELKRRLVSRGTESPEVVEARMKRAAQEAEAMTSYDYIAVNDDLDTCVEEVHRLIQSQHNRVCYNREFMNQICTDMKNI